MEQNASGNRKMRPEKILEMFLEVKQQHPSKSYDFPISNLLDEYMQSRIIPNFTEAAMVIHSAGEVYCRKVDHLECLLMAMNSKQNSGEQKEGAEQSDKTEKKRPPSKRHKTPNQSSTNIDIAALKQIKKSSTTEEKMNLNSSDICDSDRFKNYCQAVKSKTPVFYERVNLLISDTTDNCFDGTRPISKDDPDCQKNYSVFVGCISFMEKQLMSQREFLNRIQFDDFNSNFDLSAATMQQNVLNSTGLNGNEHVEQSSVFAGDSTNAVENDMLESLREASWLMDRINDTMHATDDCDSGMMDNLSQVNSTVEQVTMNDSSQVNSTAEQVTMNDLSQVNSTAEQATMNDSSQLNSTAEQSTTNDSSQLNSTADQTNVSNLNESLGMDSSVANSTLISELANSTLDVSNSQINGDSTCEGIASLSAISNLTAESELISMSGELNNISGPNDSGALNGTGISDAQIDPLSSTPTINANDSTETINSNLEKSESYDDTRNIFRIDEAYLKLNEIFRLPLSVLEQEVKIKLNIFGIPFGRLRRQVKFTLPKAFDSLRITNKRTRDADDSSITGRKITKLNDGTATPTVEVAAALESVPAALEQVPAALEQVPAALEQVPAALEQVPAALEQVSSEGGPSTVELTDPSLIPPSNNAETTSEFVNGSIPLNNDNADCSINESQLVQENGPSLINVSCITDCPISDSQTTLEDGPSLPKMPRIEIQGDTLSQMDSGIGTLTEESIFEGTITNRRMSIDLTPTTYQLDTENSTEAEELSANRIQEMTNLSEKVSSWHQRLKPILKYSEQRNDFDVKETSRNIVGCFTDCDISFKDVMENRNRADTARYFFSMLQMANNENIRITVNHHDSSALCPADQIKLKLLDPDIREIDLDSQP